MRHARRYIGTFTATLIALATWCIATTTTAYAMRPAQVGGGDVAPAAPSTSAAGLPLWQFLAFVALGVLMAVAIVGLGYSLSHSRRSQLSPREQTPLRS
jgi:hypothetical protein